MQNASDNRGEKKQISIWPGSSFDFLREMYNALQQFFHVTVHFVKNNKKKNNIYKKILFLAFYYLKYSLKKKLRLYIFSMLENFFRIRGIFSNVTCIEFFGIRRFFLLLIKTIHSFLNIICVSLWTKDLGIQRYSIDLKIVKRKKYKNKFIKIWIICPVSRTYDTIILIA